MNFIALLIAASALSVAFVWGDCGTDENNLNNQAKSHSQGKSPDGRCYSHVADYIDAVGFGGINKGHFNDAIPSAYWSYAYQFAEYLNQGNNAANLCLKNDQSKYSNNPYKAPTGSIVVVRAGTPGTANPVAGDIAVVGGSGNFWNGGEMSYGGSGNFPSNNDYVLGIYVPTTCTPNCPGAPNLGGSNNTTEAKKPIASGFEKLYRKPLTDSCNGPHESCCPAPMDDVHNCPDSARTSDCDAKKSCCCA